MESEYGDAVGENLYLGVVHKDLPAPRLIKVPHMEQELLLIVEDQIRQGKAVSYALPGAEARFRLPDDAE